MKTKKLIIWVIVLAVFLGTLFLIGYLKFQKDLTKDLNEGLSKMMADTSQVDGLCLSFKVKYSRWPKNKAELQNYMKNNQGMDFDLTSYKNLTLRETPQKTLKIHYDSFNKGDVSTGPSDEELRFNSSK